MWPHLLWIMPSSHFAQYLIDFNMLNDFRNFVKYFGLSNSRDSVKYSEGCLDMFRISPESLILSVFVHGGGEVAGVAAGLLPRPKLGAAARRGLGSRLGGDRSITTLQAASRGIQHQTDMNS